MKTSLRSPQLEKARVHDEDPAPQKKKKKKQQQQRKCTIAHNQNM